MEAINLASAPGHQRKSDRRPFDWNLQIWRPCPLKVEVRCPLSRDSPDGVKRQRMLVLTADWLPPELRDAELGSATP